MRRGIVVKGEPRVYRRELDVYGVMFHVSRIAASPTCAASVGSKKY